CRRARDPTPRERGEDPRGRGSVPHPTAGREALPAPVVWSPSRGDPMSATRPFALFCAVACIAAACSRQPELDLTAGGPARAAAAPAANAAAPPITPGAELPPGHPPL